MKGVLKVTEADVYVFIWVVVLPFMIVFIPLLFGKD